MALRLRPLAPPLPLRRRTLDVAWRCPANTTLVVDKPPGVTSQELLSGRYLADHDHPAPGSGRKVWLPHRLDKFTQGLQVLCLSARACAEASAAVRERAWAKRYAAVVALPAAGLPAGSGLRAAGGGLRRRGALASSLRRRADGGGGGGGATERAHPYVPNTMLYEEAPRGSEGARECTTEFEVRAESPCGRYALLDLRLLTGRTHQIRVQLSAAGAPVANCFYYNRDCYGYAAAFDYRPGRAAAEAAAPSLNGFREAPSSAAFKLGLQARHLSLPEPGAPERTLSLTLPLPENWPSWSL